MNLRTQKRLASNVLKVGANRVRFDPDRLEDISEALTRDDIRALSKDGAIYVPQKKGVSRGRARVKAEKKRKGRGKGTGSRSGTSNARMPKKRAWITRVRALRDELRKMKADQVVTVSEYRKLYRQIKGNLFHSRRHLREQVERSRKNV